MKNHSVSLHDMLQKHHSKLSVNMCKLGYERSLDIATVIFLVVLNHSCATLDGVYEKEHSRKDVKGSCYL